MESVEGSAEENRVAAVSGLCFARFDARDVLPILKCSGVVRIVGFNGTILPIPDEEIDAIRTLLTSELKYDHCPLIREGMLVEVVHGPLKGISGKLLRKGTRARLLLAVHHIGRAVSVEVDSADVRPL